MKARIRQLPPVKRDAAALRVELRIGRGDGSAVHSGAAAANNGAQLLPAGNAHICKEFIKSDLRHSATSNNERDIYRVL